MREHPSAEKEFSRTLSYSWEFFTDFDLTKVNEIEEKIENLAGEFGWEGEDVIKVSIGFREIFLNAIIHGNLRLQKNKDNGPYFYTMVERGQSKAADDKKVRVKLSINREEIRIVIQDEGRKKVILQKIPQLPKKERVKKTSGRGITMAKAFFNQFDIHPIEKDGQQVGTEVVMVKEK